MVHPATHAPAWQRVPGSQTRLSQLKGAGGVVGAQAPKNKQTSRLNERDGMVLNPPPQIPWEIGNLLESSRKPIRPSPLRPAARTSDFDWRTWPHAGVWLALLVLGCRKPAPIVPTEPMLSFLTTAPLLNEIEDDEGAALVAHRGDLALEGRALPALSWKGAMGSDQATREGPMVELRLSAGGGVFYGFRSDQKPAQPVPTAQWICEHVADTESGCVARLQRARADDGTVVAWRPYESQPTPVVVISDGGLESVLVGSISEARLMKSGSTTVLLLSTRTASADGTSSGGRLTPVRVTGGPVAVLGSLVTDEVDGRTSGEVRTRLVQVELGETQVRLRGERRVTPLDGGAPSESTPIDERYQLVDGALVPIAH